MRERYPFSEDVVCHPGKWTTMERGIQYLRELAMQEMVYYDPDNVQLLTDPDEVQCTRLVWWTFVQSTPPAYVKSLAVLAWKDEEAPTVNEVAGQLQQYEENLSSSLRACVSAVERLSEKSKNFFEKLSQEFWQLKEDTSNSPLVWTSISAVRSKCSSPQERGYRGYTPRGTLWFYLRDHGEDMRKWDVKPTSTQEAQACELQGKTISNGGSSRKIAAPVSSEQFPRQSSRTDFTSDLMEGASDSYLQEVNNKDEIQTDM
ncbi:ubiquitin carboxyl-terminal hydrolase 4 [Grus japonensis]|uniref:Ubiquitin carboxyl-terminal hydrolase 4 n=1 Tax=Grus japonensis TaxID=30415 RepID=A0ABC9YI44_GRUJA